MEIRTIQEDKRVYQSFTFDTPWLLYAEKDLPDSNIYLSVLSNPNNAYANLHRMLWHIGA